MQEKHFRMKSKQTLAAVQDTIKSLQDVEESLKIVVAFEEGLEKNGKENGQVPWETKKGMYDADNNTLHIDAEESEFVPAYLKYVLEYLGLPADTIIKFKK